MSFNPRLTSAARRTAYQYGRYLRRLVSIRASGELDRLNQLILWNLVSIRASLQQRGELDTQPKGKHGDGFQSAPHFSSEANPGILNFVANTFRFQSAPHFSSEANASGRGIAKLSDGFNPRLTSAARRT